MAISDKTRKILWGRSGGRCAFCKRELLIDATFTDDESVVGEECHIVSAKGQGPRHEPTFPIGQLNEPENLVLLCRVHHKIVDDQCETYTTTKLRELKVSHERWVSSTLSPDNQPKPVRVRRIEGKAPEFLLRVMSGQALFAILEDANAFDLNHDEPQTEVEVELLSSFLQEIQDYGDLYPELEAGERVKSGYRMGAYLRELEAAGYFIFGGREVRRLEGGVGLPSPFPVAILRVLRATNPAIVGIDYQVDTALNNSHTSVNEKHPRQ